MMGETFGEYAKARAQAETNLAASTLHYGTPGDHYEVIRILKAKLSPEEFRGFCKGNVIKYLLRAGLKEGSPASVDYDKALSYTEWLVKPPE